MSFMKRYLRRFPYAFAGVFFALRHDFSFKFQVILGALFFGIVGYLCAPLSNFEVFALGLAYVLILITELQNSALEEALDHLHPELHMRIGRTKDMAAGSVLLAAFFALFVVAIVWFY